MHVPTHGPSALLIVLALAAASPAADEISAPDPAQASHYLEFESVNDGRCQNLSDGGKLRIVLNRHAERPIAFRLRRTFVGIPQGLADGIAPAGSAPVKLGCTRVDGREQDWDVVRASFTSEDG